MPMTLYAATASPFVRTVQMAAMELGLDGEITVERTAVKPTEPNPSLQRATPLRKIPALGIEDGTVIVDSPVICEYLADRAGDRALFALGAPERWAVATDYAIARQMAECAVAARYEAAVRPADKQWEPWVEDQFDKIGASLDRFEAAPPSGEPVTIVHIALAAALGYLDFRFADYGWRDRAPGLARWFETFAARPSFAQTMPTG